METSKKIKIATLTLTAIILICAIIEFYKVYTLKALAVKMYASEISEGVSYANTISFVIFSVIILLVGNAASQIFKNQNK